MVLLPNYSIKLVKYYQKYVMLCIMDYGDHDILTVQDLIYFNLSYLHKY